MKFWCNACKDLVEAERAAEHLGHRAYSFGALLTPPKAYQFKPPSNVRYDMSLPSRVDLRSVFAQAPYLPFDQGNQGSCTANCGCADKTYEELLFGTSPGVAFSRAFLYWEERKLHGWQDEDSGAEMEDIGAVLGKLGVCLDPTMPYHDYDYRTKPSNAALAEALEWTADREQTRVDVSMIKQFICHTDSTFHPVRIGVPIPQSFLKSEIGGFVPMPSSGEGILGGHALLVVGYDDDLSHGGLTGYYIVLNSWGKLYGAGGYVYIPYKWMDYYADQCDNRQQLDSTPGPGPGPTPPPKPSCLGDFWDCLTHASNPLVAVECFVNLIGCLFGQGASEEEIRQALAVALAEVKERAW
jgi:hypothetical protein